MPILDEIKNLYGDLRLAMKGKWNRDLPFDEMLFDRWERAKSLGFGEGTSIYHNSYVFGDVKVGKNTWIGMFRLLDGSGGLEIGDNCSISAGVHIYTHDSVRRAISGGKTEIERSPVKMGDCCYIGPYVVITKGVKIGSHSIVGAYSLVNKDVPPYTKVAGNPAIAVGRVNVESV